MTTRHPKILECTLRDGSYVIDFQFTARDTAIIAAALENVGFDLIEVGHGVGLNASRCGKGVAAATDEAYMQAASSTLKRAKWGMFFIPGIGRHEDLEMAARYEMDFVRIGTNATEVQQSQEYIQHAKELGMFVSANLMKSYVLPPKELALQAAVSEKYGADLICLVDSAGGMMPEDIRAYMMALRDTVHVPLGLHCHDNLSLGIANVLTAIDCGAVRIDSTLQGMGRGGGNPVTEVLVTVLRKRGIDLGINLTQLMDIGERIIKPIVQERGWDSINITSGYARFHSSYLQTILKYADLYQVDARDLIVGVCEVDQTYAPDELVERVARRLQGQQIATPRLHAISLPRLTFPHTEDDPSLSLSEDTRKLAMDMRATAKKTRKSSVLNIVAALKQTGHASVSRFVQEEFNYVIGNVQVDSLDQLATVVGAADGVVDVFLVDSDARPFLRSSLPSQSRSLSRHSKTLGYSDTDVWVRSVVHEIGSLKADVGNLYVTIIGSTPQALRTALHLVEQGAMVTLTGRTQDHLVAATQPIAQILGRKDALRIETDVVQALRQAQVLVAFHEEGPVVTADMLRLLPPDSVVFDGSIGSVVPEAIAWGVRHGVRIVRPDMRAALAGELASLLGAAQITNELLGRSEIAGVPVVAGGLVGQMGDVVVDSVTNPSRVVGIADGKGHVLYHDTVFRERIETVEGEINRRRAMLT